MREGFRDAAFDALNVREVLRAFEAFNFIFRAIYLLIVSRPTTHRHIITCLLVPCHIITQPYRVAIIQTAQLMLSINYAMRKFSARFYRREKIVSA